MRKTWIILPLALLAFILTPILAYTHAPAESHATVVLLPTPSATPTYPACVTEDGAGQAVCWWDAQRQGNGLGESVLSGDCAYEDERTRTLCINLHAQDSEIITNEDGSMNTIPNGVDLVGECQDEFQTGQDEWLYEELQECFIASM